jgi:hypothetical protein
LLLAKAPTPATGSTWIAELKASMPPVWCSRSRPPTGTTARPLAYLASFTAQPGAAIVALQNFAAAASDKSGAPRPCPASASQWA